MKTENNKLAEVHGNIQFFEFLKEPTKRFSRFEAYIYLLNKACERYRPANISPKFIPEIGEGQFFTTVSEIATDLHANRATVREFLSKLSLYGHLIMEKSLKGMLCTMTHLTIHPCPAIAIDYSFDAMAKFTMHSWGRGEIDDCRVAEMAGQMTRSAAILLGGHSLSEYTRKDLSSVSRLLAHYALEAAIASLPRMTSLAQTILDKTSAVDDCLVELLDGYLSGNWAALLALLSDRTNLTIEGLALAVEKSGDADRTSIWESLREEAILLTGIELPPVLPDYVAAESAHKTLSSENDDACDNDTSATQLL